MKNLAVVTTGSKQHAASFDFITSKVTYCGDGTWFIQEFDKNGRATGAASVYRNTFDVSADEKENKGGLFNAVLYEPYAMEAKESSCTLRDKRSFKLKITTVIGVTFNRNGYAALTIKGERSVKSIRVEPGEYIVLSPVAE